MQDTHPIIDDSGDEGKQLNNDESCSSSKAPNPFLKFACESPRRQGRAPEGTPTTPSPVALGKRKEATYDSDLLGSPSKSPSNKEKRSSSRKSPKRARTYEYEHLRPLDDDLAHGLDIVFCGINPGQLSAKIGHHFGNPNNHFWSCLHESGLTSRKLDPREDFKLLDEFSIGLTNLVERPTAEQSELSRKEQLEGVPLLLEKIALYQPLIVCFVGLGIADIFRAKVAGKKGDKVKADVGLQGYKMVHSSPSNYPFPATKCQVVETLFYAVSSTSGRVVKYQKVDKIQQFKNLRLFRDQVKKGIIDTTDLEVISNLIPS